MIQQDFRAWGVAETGIGKVAVIGAGAMGGGIAAQFANAGLPVYLFDMGSEGDDPAAIARAGIARQVKIGGFMAPENAARVTPASIDHDLAKLAECDWIVEAIVERLDVKTALFAKIETVRRAGTIISSNTSTIPRAKMVAAQGPAFGRDFLITHFFNPPRQMPLLEIIAGPESPADHVTRTARAGEVILGKTVILCRDTPGFIANRIGCYWLGVAAIESIRRDISVELADAVHGAFGVPKTGAFGLLDLVGVDLVPTIWGSLIDNLPAQDAVHHHNLPTTPLIQKMVAAGQYGRKAGGGFYRQNPDKSRDVLDLHSGDYRPQAAVDPASLPGKGRDLALLLDDPSAAGQYAWQVFSLLVNYAADCAAEIAQAPADIDTAMRLGYAWREGPFALAERYGLTKYADRLRAEGRPVPALLAQAATTGRSLTGSQGESANPARLSLPTLRLTATPRAGNEAASVWDLGQGTALLEIRTKMNAVSPAVLDVIEDLIPALGGEVSALVIGNDHPRAFSAGADLATLLAQIDAGEIDKLTSFITRGQAAYQALKHAPAPVVAAVQGFALGGGCELALHADRIVAHAEMAAGLPEVNVGIIPGWGGCAQMLLRHANTGVADVAAARTVMALILQASHSGSAAIAAQRGILRQGDIIAMHRDDLLTAATAEARAMAAAYTAPAVASVQLSGAEGYAILEAEIRAAQNAGEMSDTQAQIARHLAAILTGGPQAAAGVSVTETQLMAAEVTALSALARLPASQDRMRHLLATGKPLKN